VDHRQDNTTGFLLSLAVHAVFFVCLALAMLSCDRYNAVIERLQLPQFLGVQCMKPVSVEGPIIEATLVKFTAPPLPRTAPQPVRPVRQPPPKPRERVETPELPPAPPVADDRVNQDRVDRDGQLPPDTEQREQEEKRRREQQLLEEQERLTRVEQDRQQQLEDIKKQREEAERVRKVEEQRLAQLEDKQRQEQAEQQRDIENKHLQDLLEQANLEQQAGN
jgi:colicin import membrane protein